MNRFVSRSVPTGATLVLVGLLFVVLGWLFALRKPVFLVDCLLGGLVILWGLGEVFGKSLSITPGGIRERHWILPRRRMDWTSVASVDWVKPPEAYDGCADLFLRITLKTGRRVWIPDTEYGEAALKAAAAAAGRAGVDSPTTPDARCCNAGPEALPRQDAAPEGDPGRRG